jgi:hypothetical protein
VRACGWLLAFPWLTQAGEALPNPHNESNLQTMPLFKACFWPKKGAVLQKNPGPTENI